MIFEIGSESRLLKRILNFAGNIENYHKEIHP
jgi:hypothetical protein